MGEWSAGWADRCFRDAMRSVKKRKKKRKKKAKTGNKTTLDDNGRLNLEQLSRK